MSISDIKREARLRLHTALGEPCVYHDRDFGPVPSAEQSAEGLVLSARFKSKLRSASTEDGGLAILENVESLIFSQEQLDALDLTLESTTAVHFPGYGITFVLDQELDGDGPNNRYWTVTRE